MTAAVAVLQQGATPERLVDAAAQLAWLAVLAGALAAAVALGYRWYVRERVPGGLPALVGLSAVALYLGTSRALSQVIGNTGDPFDEATALANVATFLLALLATRVGTNVGDRVGTDVFVATGATTVESEVSRVVQAVGRVIAVEVPDEVDDIVGYDPVPEETKAKLAGKTFVFPRRLTVSELRDRLVTRLKADYAVGHVDIELADDGTVEYLALGSRAAGIGPTLPPETSAVAVRADPAFAASAGDLVQVWRRDPFERVLTAEVRAVADDVVTLAVDAADTRKLDDGTAYKLVTLPVESRPDREFVSLLQAADETMAAVTVAAGSALEGQPVGALDVTVVALRPTDGPVEPLPGRERLLGAGESLYLVAIPEAIRKVEAAASAPAEPRPAPSSGAVLSPDERVAPQVAGDDTTQDAGPTDPSGDDAGRVELGEPGLSDIDDGENGDGEGSNAPPPEGTGSAGPEGDGGADDEPADDRSAGGSERWTPATDDGATRDGDEGESGDERREGE